jgi:imidazolonepropionase-like amidohydrolase
LVRRQSPESTGARRKFLQTVLVGTAAAAAAGAVGARTERGSAASAPATTIVNARLFDGQWVLDADSVIIENGRIAEIGNNLSRQGTLVDAHGGTLLPGLIDAHTHPFGTESLRLAALFGVTTELDMGGDWTAHAREAALADNQIADFRTTLVGMSPPGGHPSELFKIPFATSNTLTADDARAYVRRDIERGYDYVKVAIEDGEVMGTKLPVLSKEAIDAAVLAGHGYGKMVIAHAMTKNLTELAVASGVDGLAHLFLDGHASDHIVCEIARSRVFVVPCLVLDWSIAGGNDKDLANDPRVVAKLPEDIRRNISTSFNTYPAGRFDDFLASVAALREAGVDVLTGTDSGPASPVARAGIPAHGASLHRELQLFVKAGFSPIEALRAATSVPARRFDLRDRGRIMTGLRADLLLVDGDPTRDISSTLSIKKVWKKGVDIKAAAVA